jgi:hypothetical protein
MASSALDSSVPIYCEASTGWLLEPINTITNISFFITAWLLWRRYQRGGASIPRDVKLLIFLIIGTGIGSTLWHATQTGWGLFLDALFIQLFMLAYIASYLKRHTEWRVGVRGVLVLLFMGVSVLFPALWPLDYGQTSAGYVPALILLVVFGLHQHRILNFKSAESLGIAACVFAVSLVLRTADNEVCDAFPTGLHFMWHILNGVVLYVSVIGLTNKETLYTNKKPRS